MFNCLFLKSPFVCPIANEKRKNIQLPGVFYAIKIQHAIDIRVQT